LCGIAYRIAARVRVVIRLPYFASAYNPPVTQNLMYSVDQLIRGGEDLYVFLAFIRDYTFSDPTVISTATKVNTRHRILPQIYQDMFRSTTGLRLQPSCSTTISSLWRMKFVPVFCSRGSPLTSSRYDLDGKGGNHGVCDLSSECPVPPFSPVKCS
jgi:hypothetical protein